MDTNIKIFCVDLFSPIYGSMGETKKVMLNQWGSNESVKKYVVIPNLKSSQVG